MRGVYKVVQTHSQKNKLHKLIPSDVNIHTYILILHVFSSFNCCQRDAVSLTRAKPAPWNNYLFICLVHLSQMMWHFVMTKSTEQILSPAGPWATSFSPLKNPLLVMICSCLYKCLHIFRELRCIAISLHVSKKSCFFLSKYLPVPFYSKVNKDVE